MVRTALMKLGIEIDPTGAKHVAWIGDFVGLCSASQPSRRSNYRSTSIRPQFVRAMAREAREAKPAATAKSLDHIVLTVQDLGETVKFYQTVLNMKHTSFTSPSSPGITRHALSFGDQKINLHIRGQEFEPKAQVVQPGSADRCFLVQDR